MDECVDGKKLVTYLHCFMTLFSIESHGGYFYLNHVDYDDAWVDIAPNVSVTSSVC